MRQADFPLNLISSYWQCAHLDSPCADAGSGPGKISLYVGKECVERNIPAGEAEERLIQLIKDHGKWVDAV